jgi:AraC-like DNA-binding protein
LAGKNTDPRDNGLLVYAALSSTTFGEALKIVQRYMHVLNEAVEVDMELSSEAVRLRFDFIAPTALDLRQAIEFGVANLVRSLRFLVGTRLRPAEVTFIHLRKHELTKFERFFSSRVRFGAQENSVVFSRRQLALPIGTADPRLLRILTRYGDEVLAVHAHESPDLRHQVEKIIMKRLSRGDAGTPTVAHDLGMSARTLARRLSELGTTFAQILDELRHVLALSHLCDDRLALSEIALLLGYSDLSAFNHAFRRWTGTTPGHWRSKQ